MNTTKRFYIICLVAALLTFMFMLPAGATDGLATVPGEDVVLADAEIPGADVPVDIEVPAEDAVLFAANDASTENEVLAADAGEEAFEGNAIGKWLDKTFYAFDYAVFTAFSKLQKEAITPVVNLVTHLGDTEFAIPMILLGLILSLFKKTRKVGITLFCAIIIGTLFTNVVLKNVCGRARPYVTLSGDADFMSWYTRAGANIESDNSFPSGHTTCAFEIGFALLFTVRSKKIRWIFPVYSVVILCTRLYLMVHYCTDVCMGVVVGICAALIAYAIAKAILKNDKIAEFDLAAKFKKKA